MDEELCVVWSKKLLISSGWFFQSASKMIQQWPKAAEVNLSNKSRNRQAWIGQATCCYMFGANEHQVKEAWHLLTEEEQSKANAIADEIIEIWESTYA